MFSSFSIFWWFPDFEQNGYLNNLLNKLTSLECGLHSEGFFYSKFSLSTLPDGRQAIGRKVCLVLPRAYQSMEQMWNLNERREHQ